MKKRTKVVIALSVACLGTLLLGACTTSSPYEDFYQDGYGVTVRYDSNGGNFGSTEGVDIVVTYPTEKVQRGVKLIEPGDDNYGEESVITTASRDGYFLAGWYAAKEPRIADGKRLDEYGNPYPVNEKGEPIRTVTVVGTDENVTERTEVIPEDELAYTYSGKWDFENDVLQISDVQSPQEGEYTLTLYAAWVPQFIYRAYAQSDTGWEEIGTTKFDPLHEPQYAEIPVPALNETTGAYSYGRFPKYSDHTFEAAYHDAAKTQPVGDVLQHGGSIDYEHGIAVNPIKEVYADWKEGVWFEITKAEQFLANASLKGCYNIHADLDFNGLSWNVGIATSAEGFSGKIIGIGGVKKFSNIQFEQANNQNIYGGLFGRIVEGATISNINFENAKYILGAGSRAATGGYFGLFAGTIAPSAKIENVTVNGMFLVGNVYPNYDAYHIGLLTGTGSYEGVAHNIIGAVYDYKLGTNFYYSCIVTIHSDETITLSKNSDTSVKPEVRYEN